MFNIPSKKSKKINNKDIELVVFGIDCKPKCYDRFYYYRLTNVASSSYHYILSWVWSSQVLGISELECRNYYDLSTCDYEYIKDILCDVKSEDVEDIVVQNFDNPLDPAKNLYFIHVLYSKLTARGKLAVQNILKEYCYRLEKEKHFISDRELETWMEK